MLTVEKTLCIPKLKNISVVAGKAGLQRKVGHVTVMEVPDIVQWLKGDDFLVTSLYALKEDGQAQCRLIKSLARSSCACIAVKTGQYVKELSDEIKAAADGCGFPLLQIPYDLSYIDIITNITNYIYEERNPKVVFEKYIKDILFESYSDQALMLERGNMLGISIDKHQYMAMVIQFSSQDDQREAGIRELWRAGFAIAQFASSLRDLHHCIAVNLQFSCTVFFGADDAQTLGRLTPFIEKEALTQLGYSLPKRRTLIGFGNPESGFEGVRNTYVHAVKACEVGQLFYPDRRSYLYSELEVNLIFAEICGKKHCAALALALEKIKTKDIVETLVKYYECNTSIEATAAKLFTHKNTVIYRLHRVKELTGLDVKDFNDSLKLYMAVVAYKLGQPRK